MYVQYGCGLSAPAGWLNFDASATLRFERLPLIGKLYTRNTRRFPENVRYGDITRGLPIPVESCAGIYASHVLEHLALEDFDRALANTYRYLRAGGTFRLVVPDLRLLARTYLDDPSETAAITFISNSGLGRQQRPRGLAFVREWLGNSAHLWLWDERSLTAKLREHGFACIRQAHFADAEDPRFLEVEDAERFEGAIAMSAVR
jgi:SAM-dependent methyltransferase